MDRTVLTIILLGNFVEDLKYDEQCVILLIKFRFDLSLVDPTSRTLDVSVQVGLTFDKYSSEEVGLKGATVPIHYLGWAKNARYNINSYIDFYFCDSEEYLDIDMELVEFSIGKIVGNSDTDDSEVLVWMGVAYSVPYGSPSSARLSQNLTAEDPIFTINNHSHITRGYIVPNADDGEEWWDGRPSDPRIVGDTRVLFFGDDRYVPMAAFDPDINIPEHFFSSCRSEVRPVPAYENAVSTWRGLGRGRGRGRGRGTHDHEDVPPFGRGRGHVDYGWQWGDEQFEIEQSEIEQDEGNGNVGEQDVTEPTNQW